jgi:DNA polymerase-3 subunit gamma/tau
MLKTLEEPPEHLKFILATTDPQKIPVTVLSRCLQFNLKQMPRAAIGEHLQRLLEKEEVAFEPDAVLLIGRAASGSMRDALSLLDQAIAHGGGRVTSESVRDMLGAIDQSYLLRLVEAVAADDARAVLDIANELQARSVSFDAALADLASLLLKLSIVQLVPGALDEDLPERSGLEALAGRLDAESVQLYYQIAVQGREDLPLAPDEHAGFVMTLLRMVAFRPEGGVFGPAGAPPAGSASRSTPTAAAPKSAAVAGAGTGVPARSASGPAAGAAQAGEWPELVRQLPVTGAARELARHAELRRRDGMSFELVVPKARAYLADRSYQEKLRAALAQQLGADVHLKVGVGEVTGMTTAKIETNERDARQAEATKAVHEDGFVKDLVNLFDATVLDSTIKAGRKEGS